MCISAVPGASRSPTLRSRETTTPSIGERMVASASFACNTSTFAPALAAWACARSMATVVRANWACASFIAASEFRNSACDVTLVLSRVALRSKSSFARPNEALARSRSRSASMMAILAASASERAARSWLRRSADSSCASTCPFLTWSFLSAPMETRNPGIRAVITTLLVASRRPGPTTPSAIMRGSTTA